MVSENDAGAIEKVVTPLRLSTADDIAPVVRHERKSGGHISDSARGSSAISGSVDRMLRISGTPNAQRPNRRLLEGVGGRGLSHAYRLRDTSDHEHVSTGPKL